MQVHRNTFDGGLNSNISKNLLQPNKYTEANNVNIAATNNFFSLENIQGSTALVNLLPSAAGSRVSGIFASRYKVGSVENVDGVTIFTYSGTTFTIWCYAGDLYKMYEETITTAYANAKPMMNAISYPENGFDILYFTDNVNELRKIKCEIPSGSLATPTVAFLTAMDLKLISHGANGKIELSTIDTTGSLFCGSYQFAYQLVNTETNQYTKFSLFTNPIHVYLDGSTTNPRSGVGLQSKAAITLTITPSEEEMAHYTHFRLAVLENIEPDDVNVETVQLTKLEAIADFISGATIANVKYGSNSRIESAPLADLVIDKLALDTVKTLTIRDNRMVGGNVTYKDLSLNNPSGEPIISGGSVLKQTGGGSYDNLFCDPALASKYRGYFRGEVYRFAISYFDEDGNFSYPKVLDLSSVTHNQITGAYKDMKFPSRNQNLGGTTYTLFSSTEGIQSLGLRLTGIDRHPTWAKGFVILRAERLKNVLFQTPLIPMMQHDSIGAVEKYPYTALELSGATTKSVDYLDATPMGPFTTYLPRNYFFLRNRAITRYNQVSGGATVNVKFTGETFYTFNTGYNTSMIFTPSFLYADKPFTFNPTHKLVTVDAALLKGKFTDFSSLNIGSTSRGKNIRTSVAGTYYAVQDTQYYYDSGHNGLKAAIGGSRGFTSYSEFPNFGSGDVVGGKNVYNHDKFTTEGFTWGQVGSTQKSAVVRLDSNVTEINSDGLLTFAAGSQIAHSGDTTFYLTDSTLVHTVEIANVEAGLGDTRYGSYDTPYDFIFTGTIYTFTNAELATVAAGTTLPKTVDIWGGDCYVAPHLFKITDTVYGVTNEGKNDGSGGEATSLASVQNWERAFNDDTANQCAVSIPVPFKNAASFIEIVLESEYNPSVPDAEIINVLTTDGTETTKIPIYGINSDSESNCRVPLTYKLNNNHKKTNSDKVFQIKDPLIEEITNLGARIIYSDQKVYQTSITGFDTFRVANYKDLLETHGDVIRLETSGDDLYAFQEKAITYLTVGNRALETADGITLAIQSGDFIGNMLPIHTFSGTQHIASVVNSGNAIYYTDNERKALCRLAGRQVQILSENAITSSLKTPLEGRRFNTEILSIYDPIHKQVWFVHNGSGGVAPYCYIYDEARDIWVSNYGFIQSCLMGGVYSGGKLYLVGNNTNSNITLDEMYTGNRTTLFGTTVTPNVKFVVNPDMEISKVFDDILVSSSDRLNTVDFTVLRESALGNQAVSGITLDISSRGEGTFKAKILRDSAGARLRGLLAIGTLNWQTGVGELAVAVPSVLTKYRISENRF